MEVEGRVGEVEALEALPSAAGAAGLENMENTVGPRRMKLSPAYPMRAAWLLAFISLLMLLTASAVAEECGCTAHAASDHIELETNAAPTVTRERVFEEAANTAQQMREIRMKGGFVTYGTVDAIIYVDQEGSW